MILISVKYISLIIIWTMLNSTTSFFDDIPFDDLIFADERYNRTFNIMLLSDIFYEFNIVGLYIYLCMKILNAYVRSRSYNIVYDT